MMFSSWRKYMKKNQKDSFIPKENSFIPINETINLTFVFVVNILYPPILTDFYTL